MKKLLNMILVLPALVCSCGRVELGNDEQGDNPPYEVGDIYNIDGKKGIVFYVTDGGQHGKIVSIDKTECEWSTERVVTGATDENDGMANMRKIQSILGWREKYPAFAWCADKGYDWYLPAKNELITIYKTIDFDEDRSWWTSEYYWSSTEEDYLEAWYVYMSYGSTDNDIKDSYNDVRAVSAF